MVKIRFPRGTSMIRHSVIQIAIDKTGMKFDNNIEANRFDQVGNHYEVTIKCKSPRGKGAKHGYTGRRTTSCCWHVWGTFFDELFNLNSDIVITAQGNRITKDSGNWVDREVGQGIRESTMCNCEANGWVREQDAHDANAHADACGVYMPDYEELEPLVEPTRRECDSTCRHNSSNNNGILCARSCDGSWNPGWEPVVESPSQTCLRRCRTCRHSRLNNGTQALCVVSGCRYPEIKKWELYIPTANVLDETYYDHCGRFYSKPTGGLMETEPLRFKVPEEE